MKNYICELVLNSGIRVLMVNITQERLDSVREALNAPSPAGLFNLNTEGMSHSIPWRSVELLSFIEANVQDGIESASIYFPENFASGNLQSRWDVALEEAKQPE